jgi:hypothetical protein
MKNYIIGTLLVIILVLSSVLYKKNETSVGKKFPILEETNNPDIEVPLYLYVFLKKNNCIDCLEFIEVLNHLPSHFKVFGVVPKDELKDEDEFRHISGAQFQLISSPKYRKHTPFYTPSTIGVSPEGDIIFVLPGVPGGKKYLEHFLDTMYNKIYMIFINEKYSKHGA